MTAEQILNNLRNAIYAPVYLLHGEESYYIDVISDYIEEHVLSDTEKEFNQHVLYGRDIDEATIVEVARRYPMMANYQVLIIKEAQDLKEPEKLIPYLQQPLPSTILVLCHKHGKVDKRKTFPKVVEKQGVLFESPRIYDNKVPGWIEQEVRLQGYRIAPKAAVMMADFLGTDLSRIANEIRKLSINIPSGSEITDALVEQHIGISKDFNVFELQKALGYRHVVKANQIIAYFAGNQRENPMVKVVPILFAYFTKVFQYHFLKDKSSKAAAAALGVNPFFIQDYVVAAKNYPPTRLERIVGLLREYDLRSKGVDNASTSEKELMRELIYRILH